MTASQMTAIYVDDNGYPRQMLTVGERSLPIRDSNPGSRPWYTQEGVKSLDQKDGYIVETEDRPHTLVPWQTPDKQATLSYSQGSDIFITWLVARQKSTAKLISLYWISWMVDWGSSFDFATQTGSNTGAGGQVIYSGEGEGPLTPLTGDPIANDAITVTWGPP